MNSNVLDNKSLKAYIRKELSKFIAEQSQTELQRKKWQEELKAIETLIWKTITINDVKALSPPLLQNWAIGFSQRPECPKANFTACWKVSDIIAREIVRAFTRGGRMSLLNFHVNPDTKAAYIVLKYKR